MANNQHLAILNRAISNNAISRWNHWVNEHPDIDINLDFASLNHLDLRGINLSKVSLVGADFRYSNLSQADLSHANLNRATLSNAKLRQANLRFATFVTASLINTELNGAILDNTKMHRVNLTSAKLEGSSLVDADLSGSILERTILYRTGLKRANFYEVVMQSTRLSLTDLSQVKNLETVYHRGPSSVDTDTLILSRDSLSTKFLEGCGIPKHFINNLSYVVNIPAIQYYSCFISYSSHDEEFCQALYANMKHIDLRVWFAPEEMKGGKKIHEQVFEAIRYYDKTIIVLSEASIRSNWIKLEIQRARWRELEENRRVLFPIRLIPYEDIQNWELISSNGEDLAEEIRQYYIPDFSNWKDYDYFMKEFSKLIESLQDD